MKIAMKVGNSKYMGIDVDRMYVVTSLDKAMVFEHAGDICEYINQNRKKINAFLRRSSLHMTIQVVDTKPSLNTADTEEVHEEAVLDENSLSENELAMAS